MSVTANESDHKVNPSTRERVLAAVRQLDSRPNALTPNGYPVQKGLLKADRLDDVIGIGGNQGSAMEELIEDGVFDGVVDLTPHELTEEVVGAGAYVPVRPGRTLAAARAGIPQVVSTGAMEYLCFGPQEFIPPRLRRRKTYFHNPNNANVKASRTEMAQVGRVMAERLNQARGRTEILIPLKGSSVYGSKGGPLYDPVGSALLRKALKQNLDPNIQLKEIDAQINDPEFADICVARLLDLFNQESQ